MSADPKPLPCWCGEARPYFDPLPDTCGGNGVIYCECGGDGLCVCHWHGEVECDGCEECASEDDSTEDYEEAHRG